MRKAVNFISGITGLGNHVVWVFAFILLPLVSLNTTQDPELMPRMSVWSIFIVAISLFFLFRKPHFSLSKPATVAISLLTLITAWSAFSIISSVNKGDAFTEWLRLSLLYYSFFVIYLLFSADVSRQVILICRYAMIAVFIFSAMGIYQGVTGWEKHNELAYYLPNTIWSTLANKNFFSECLLLFLPFLVYGSMEEKGRMKLLFAFAMSIDLVFILILQSSGVWVAAIIAALFYFVFNIYINGITVKRLVVPIVIVSISILAIAYTGSREMGNISLKVKSVKDYLQHPELLETTRIENNNSVFERLILWRNSIRMISDYPVAGAGLNNWRIYNPSYGIGGTQFTNTGLMNYEHPHNDYLLLMAEQGLAGLIIYLFFIFFIIRTGLRIIRDANEKDKRFISLLLCGVIAFVVISFFSYPRSRAYQMILFMILSVLIVSFSKDIFRTYRMKAVAYFLFILGIAGTFVFVNRVIAEMHTKKAILAQLNGNFPRMYREADKADTWLSPLDIASTPLCWYKGMAKFYMGDITTAITEYEKATAIHPYHLRLLNDLATSYEKTGRPQEAIVYYKRALEISPLFVEGNLNLSATFFNSGNADSAYYYINRIKDQPMSMREENTYKVFLKAILEKIDK